MAVNIQKKIYFILLTLFSISVIESKIVKEEKLEEISQVFNEIEKNQLKLKQEFEEILTEEEVLERKEENNFQATVGVARIAPENVKKHPECNCVPYHLCSPETGTQVSDGRYLVESRAGINLCENPIEICCTKTPAPENRVLTTAPKRGSILNRMVTTPTKPKCGDGYTSNTNQDFPTVDDPSLTNFGQFPWTVMITKNKDYACVGSLIHPRVVLTAAHCVNNLTNFTVRAGEWNANSKTEPFAHQDRNVQDIINHPEFRLDNLIYDAALLILDQEFELQENINTICLTKPAPEPLVTSNPDKCVATGWGVDEPNGRYNKIMKKIEFSLTNSEVCQNSFRTTRLGNQFLLHPSFLCAYSLHGSDTCEGNGGAPLVCSISQQPNRYQQTGIVSWGIGCANPDIPAVFTNISQIRDWIDAIFDLFGYSKEYYTE